MQYLELQSEGIFLSKRMPRSELALAIAYMESTMVVNGSPIKVLFLDGYLQIQGEGVVSDLVNFTLGLDIVRKYAVSGSNIVVENQYWETTVKLSSPKGVNCTVVA